MKKLPITEASDQQLRTFAADVQQIEKVPAERGKILAALTEGGWTQDYILVDGEESVFAESDPLPQTAQPRQDYIPFSSAKGFGFWRKGPMVKLKILSTDRPGGNEPAHPSVNGSPCLIIPRNKRVEIPYDFYLVLNNCIGTKITPGEKIEDELVHTDYTDYPLTEVELPSPQEIAKWQEFTSGNELGGKVAAKAA